MLLAQLIGAHGTDRGSQPSRADQIGQQDRRKLNRLRHHGPHRTKTPEQQSVKQFSGARRVGPSDAALTLSEDLKRQTPDTAGFSRERESEYGPH